MTQSTRSYTADNLKALEDLHKEMLLILNLYLTAPAGRRGALIRAEAHKAAHAAIAKAWEIVK